MINGYASEFREIGVTLNQRSDIRDAILLLAATQSMPGKVTEGSDRLERFRIILQQLLKGEIDLSSAIQATELQLPRVQSIYSGDNRVFANSWAERLVRTQYSRFYNQAVLEHLLATGQTQCLVPHSSDEAPNSKCSLHLAGRTHDIQTLYSRLVDSYTHGRWSKELKVPDHPHCTHVVAPIAF
jgi:hypothetical protein